MARPIRVRDVDVEGVINMVAPDGTRRDDVIGDILDRLDRLERAAGITDATPAAPERH